MSDATGGGPTVATLCLDLPCRPLRGDETGAVVEVADVRRVGDGYVALVRTSHDDAAAVAGTVSEWEAVRAADALSSAGESRLLRLELADDTVVTAAYEALVEHDVLLSECVVTDDGWDVRLTAPSHGALTAVYDRFRELGMEIEIESLGGERSDRSATDGLTDSQREALVRAVETGYFSVPRRATLRDVADRLDISDQAVSERVRRGTRRLVREHVEAADADGKGDKSGSVRGER